MPGRGSPYSTSQMRPILSNPTDASNDLLPGRSVYDENARSSIHESRFFFFSNGRALRRFTDDRSNRSLEGDGQTQSVDRSDRWMFSFHDSCFPVWCLNRHIPWLYHGVWREFGLRRLRFRWINNDRSG